MIIQFAVSCTADTGRVVVILKTVIIGREVEAVGFAVIVSQRNRTVFTLSVIAAAEVIGSVKKFVSLEENDSFLVRITI